MGSGRRGAGHGEALAGVGAGSAALLWAVVGCGHPAGLATTHANAALRDTPLNEGGTAALSMCGKQNRHHFSGPRPPKDSATPQMVVRNYGYVSSGASDPGQLTIHLSIAAGGKQPLTLGRPLGAEGPSVEIQGRDGVEVAAYGLPVKITSGSADGRPTAGPTPLDFVVVVPPAAACPGHRLSETKANSNRSGEVFSALTVAVSDPSIARHRAAHGIDASSDLLIASWPPDLNAAADGAGSFG